MAVLLTMKSMKVIKGDIIKCKICGGYLIDEVIGDKLIGRVCEDCGEEHTIRGELA